VVGLDMEVRAVVGEPLSIVGRTSIGGRAAAQSDLPLAAAATSPAQLALFREQLGRLGGTIYELRDVEATIEGGPMVPKSLLNQLRRELVTRLDGAAVGPAHGVSPALALPTLLEPILAERARQTNGANEDLTATELIVLCRRTEQIEAALELGVSTIYADYQDIKQYAAAIETVRRRGSGGRIYLATPRIEKPGESSIFAHLARQGADGILVRNAGGLRYCIDQKVPFVADFSLNAANPLSVELLKSRGALRVTASYDLSADQLFDLLEATPPEWLEIVIHQQVPMFHMEHCVFCAFLSPGTDATNCGRPCDTHDVKLRDRVGAEHPLKADVGCRNTLYNAVPQTTAEYLPRLKKHGARFVRVELLDDEPRAVERVLRLYQDVIAGRRDGKSLWRELKATNQYGVTRGALAVL
jgi:U32 family peptidase